MADPSAQPTEAEVLGWVRLAAQTAAGKTDQETIVLDVGAVLSITNWFVITGGTNTRQVKTIVEEIQAALIAAGGPKPLRIEGLESPRWVLLDYGDFVVHVFLDEARAYYDLERLWADVPRIAWAEEERAG